MSSNEMVFLRLETSSSRNSSLCPEQSLPRMVYLSFPWKNYAANFVQILTIGRSHMQEIDATLILTQQDIAYIWNGGTLAVKIDAPDTKVSLDVSTSQRGDRQRQSVRIKRVQPKRRSV